jgi:hypothetical protein
MPRYLYACRNQHEVEWSRPVADCSKPGPRCPICDLRTKRKYTPPMWNMFMTAVEAHEWAGRVQRGEESITCDFENEPERKAR